jgi:hypothetical protein
LQAMNRLNRSLFTAALLFAAMVIDRVVFAS